MYTDKIVQELKRERDRLNLAIEALEEIGSTNRLGLRKGVRRKRRLSPGVRQLMSRAQKELGAV